MEKNHKRVSEIQVKEGHCGICNCFCGIEAVVKDNKLIEVRGNKNNPLTKGFICIKGKALPEIIHAKDRITKPLKKKKDGTWETISWDEAFEIIVSNLKSIKKQYGPHTLSVHTGQSGVAMQFNEYAQRFCKAYKTPNFSTAGSQCNTSKFMANKVTVGALPIADYKNSKCIVLWGYNPASSAPSQNIYINEAIKNGAKLIVVDPQETKLAKRAELYLKIKPGTDLVLALGIINLIIKEKKYDKEFVDKWVIGFDKLERLVAKYNVEKVSKITNIEKDSIIKMADMFANNKPANISPGIAIELQRNGFQTARAISILQAITGNIDVVGGALINKQLPLKSVDLNVDDISIKAIGSKDFPLFNKVSGNAQANLYSDAILQGKPYYLKAMIVIGSNPILTWPDSNKLKIALSKLEFLVVMDNFMTETAKLAHLIIPGTNYIERNELWNGFMRYGTEVVGISNKLIEHDGITEWEFISKLAKALGLEKEFPWKSEREALEYRLENLSKSYDELLENYEGYIYGPYKEKKYEEFGFDTPSGKVEIYSKTLENLNIDPLPIYDEESLLGELDNDYPLTLSTGARDIEYYHSRFRNIKLINEYVENDKPLAKINTKTAKKYNVECGDKVVIETEIGSLNMSVLVSEDIALDTICIPHGWDKANSNELIDNENLDSVSGFPACRAIAARIKKL